MTFEQSNSLRAALDLYMTFAPKRMYFNFSDLDEQDDIHVVILSINHPSNDTTGNEVIIIYILKVI